MENEEKYKTVGARILGDSEESGSEEEDASDKGGPTYFFTRCYIVFFPSLELYLSCLVTTPQMTMILLVPPRRVSQNQMFYKVDGGLGEFFVALSKTGSRSPKREVATRTGRMWVGQLSTTGDV